jgi:hypothetical protein
MAITAAQTALFYGDADQTGIPNRTVIQLAVEGITTISDLSEFPPEALKQIAKNLCHPHLEVDFTRWKCGSPVILKLSPESYLHAVE